MIIAGDIGGTKCNLALYDVTGEQIHFATFPSQNYPNFDRILREFYEQCKNIVPVTEIQAVTLAAAGPVHKGVCRATNLPWVLDAQELQKSFSLSALYLINDLEANAYAIEILPKSSFDLLQAGESPAIGNRAVISPGTGLGEAGLFFDGKDHHPFACEGGHSEFGPRDERQIALCRYLIEQFGHASYERILSGPGIYNIYLFLRDIEKQEEPKWLLEKIGKEDPSKVISESALKGSSEICVETLTLFATILGAEASNSALKFMALGGIYIGGGIAPKIRPFIQGPSFYEGFLDKGRFRPLLEKVPIYLILDDKASLLGAAHFCRKQIAKTSKV